MEIIMWCPKEHRGIDYTTSDDEDVPNQVQPAKESSPNQAQTAKETAQNVRANKEEDRVSDSSSDDIPLIQRREAPQAKQPQTPTEMDIII